MRPPSIPHVSSRRVCPRVLVAMLLLTPLGGCADAGPVPDASVGADGSTSDATVRDDAATDAAANDGGPPADQGVDRYAWWEQERARRQAALDTYLSDNEAALRTMLYAPLGGFGVPRRAVDRFSEVMPDIWGPPEEKFAAVGLGPDLYDPSNPLPLGIAPFRSAGVDYAVIACGTCHVGRVVGPDGVDRLLFGAPNTRMNAIFNAFEQSAEDSRWNDLGAGIPGATVRTALQLRRQVEERVLLDFTFSTARNANAPDPFALDRPGYFDSFAVIFAMQTLPEALLPGTDATLDAIMPPNPAEADVMSIWLQRDRPAAEWDGSMPHAVYRNLAASVGAVGFGFAVNFEPSAVVAEFSRDLPPPPYPFPVDGVRAARGAALFQGHCATCHHAGANTVYPPAVTGTDPNRAHAITTAGRTRLLQALRSACTDSTLCAATDAEILVPVSDPNRLGYLALPLQGLWARAPYLHNGSVPTLRHLLVPSSRPASFMRGATHYNTSDVGFEWQPSRVNDPYAHAYDTTLAGRSNGGHDTLTFLGRDWGSDPEALADLLEFLKTL